MGSPEDEPEHQDDEKQHRVTVPQFFMGRYPVTQAQYEAVMDANPAAQYDADRFVAPDKPVVGVSWHEAKEFCARLSQHTGRAYGLPTEAEWEYACRAGTTTPFHFGKTLTPDLANYDGNSTYNGGPKGEFRNETTPVDHFPYANAFGLWDMHGNVWEWCEDHYHSDYDDTPTDGSAWISDDENAARILRGGCWVSRPEDCRSAYRFNLDLPRGAIDLIGFRVVCRVPRTL
jgi:formylglycine-generating enzyme required for sulfatase activity